MEAAYFRDVAEAALRLAQVSTNEVVVKTLLETAIESLGRAAAIEVVEKLRDVAAGFEQDRTSRAVKSRFH
jgi:hypothetical protein